MIRTAQWEIAAAGSFYVVKPLTVRQRLALSEDFATERAKAAAGDAALAGLRGAEAAEFVSDARRRALNVSALCLDCYSLHGQIRVLSAALGDVDTAMRFVQSVAPREATNVALEALGIDTDAIAAEEAKPASGN
jgi:hypothetical protein